MNIKEIKEMIQLMNENSLSEIEMEKEGLKIRLKKSSGYSGEPVMIQEIRQAPAAAQPAGKSAAPEAPKAPTANRTAVKSPMVGTYYSSPAPDAKPYIQIGSQVEVGQVICIVEAMKLMNEIKSEIKGKVVEILVNNGDPVEFGQPLFLVE